MKRRTTQIASILLTLAILLSILPPTASASYWPEDAEPEDPVFDAWDSGTVEAPLPADPTYYAAEEAPAGWGSAASWAGEEYYLENGALYRNGVRMDSGKVTWLILRDDALYWSKVTGDETDIWRQNLNYGNRTSYYHVFAPVESFDVLGDDLYFLYNGEIVKTNILTNEEITLMIDHSFHGFFLDENGDILAVDITRDPAAGGEDDGYIESPDDDGYIEWSDDDGYIESPDDDGYIESPDDDGYIEWSDDDGYDELPDDDGYDELPDDDGYDEITDDDGMVGLTAAPKVNLASYEWLWPVPESKKICSPYTTGISSLMEKRKAALGGNGNHNGIDILNAKNQSNLKYSKSSSSYASDAFVYAARGGTVVYAFDGCRHWNIHKEPCKDKNGNIIRDENNNIKYKTDSCCGKNAYKGLGNCIAIQHDDGTVSVYGHLLQGSQFVKKSESVSRGQVLAQIGSSGTSTGPHLHFEIRSGTKKLNVNPTLASGISPNKTYTKAEICTGGTITYKSAQGLYAPLKDVSPPTDSSIKIGPTSYPKGNIKKGKFSLVGTITSRYALSQLKGIIYDVTAGKEHSHCSSGPQKDNNKYNLKGSTLDCGLHFENLKDGHTYYLKITATDIYGKTEPWTSENFTVWEKLPSEQKVSVKPKISTSTDELGQILRISCSDSSATIHYKINNGSEFTGSSNVTKKFTTAGTYNITAWTSRAGFSNSSATSASISVYRTAAPRISDAVFTEDRAYVTISGSGTIHYTTDGSTPNRQSPQYTGPISFSNGCTVQAIAVEYGKQASAVASKSLNFSVPNAPAGVYLYRTEDKIAVGKTAVVRWPAVPAAAAYDVLLNRDGYEVSRLLDITATQAAFVLEQAGIYTICVTAKNFLGSSVESAPVTVEAMPPVTVTMIDRIVRTRAVTDETVREIQQRIYDHDGPDAPEIEGNVISKQTVDYGATIERPNTPSKTGFTFAGYSTGLNAPVTSDETLYAEFEVKTYTVEFWDDCGGTQAPAQIGSQDVMYTASAVPPAVENSPTGYLAGWNVDNAKSDCFDYTYVEGNMRLYASYTWANEDLPAIVQIPSVVRDSKGSSYQVNLQYTNNNLEDTQARLIVSLYSSRGRMVYAQTKDITLDPQQPGEEINDSITLNYAHSISRVTAVLVRTKDGLTGGAVSEMASTTNITSPDSGSWGEWSDWSENPVQETDTRQVNSAIQYRYRTKQTTTTNNGISPGEGWDWTETTSTISEWKTTNDPVSAFTTASQKREVHSTYIAPTYKTQYHYFRFYKGKSAPWTDYDKTNHPYFEEYWADKELPWLRKSGGMNQYGDGYTGNSGSKYWLIFDGSTYGGKSAVDRGLVKEKTKTRQVKTGGGYTQYLYRDIYYTYHFEKWNDWTEWTPVEAPSWLYNECQQRLAYCYRDYIPGSASSDDTPEEGTTAFSVSGSIPGVDKDYCGKKATVLVYKKTNTDPTQEQLEYVDQITIGEGNSYSFTVIPKQDVDYQKTGDFIVTLSVEGCARLVNIDVVRAEKPEYTVTFKSDDGSVVDTRQVPAGGGVDVNDVCVPAKEGHRFVKWNKSVVDVSQNLDVTAVFEKVSYPVVFVDYENQTTKVEDVCYGDPVTTYVPEPVEGKTFECWKSTGGESDTAVKGSMILTAVWTPHTYTVEFRDFDGKLVGEAQTVMYGKAAQAPSPVTKDGVTYPWDVMGLTWWNVTQDMVIYPYVPQVYSAPAPMASVPTEESYGLFSVELLLPEENESTHSIYYTIGEPLAEDDAIQYVNGLSDTSEAALQEIPSSEISENLSGNDGEYTGTEETDETDETDGYEEYDEEPELLDTIYEYFEPISVYAGNTVYAFSVNDESGEISPVAVFEYVAGEEKEGAPDASGSNAISEIGIDAATGKVTVEIAHTSQVRVVVAAYTDRNQMGAVSIVDAGADTKTVSLQLKGIAWNEVDTVKAFLLDPASATPLCPPSSKKVS